MLRQTDLLKAVLVACCVTPPQLNLWNDAGVSAWLPGAMAQVQPPPNVMWRHITSEDERAESGTYYQFTHDALQPNEPAAGTWTALTTAEAHYGEPQSPEDSGEEWIYAIQDLYEGGVKVGTVGAGYVSWANCLFREGGCIPAYTIGTPSPNELETPGKRKGDTRGFVARFDLDGNRVWYKVLLPGLAYNVVQDPNGDVVVVGNATTNVWPTDVFENGEPALPIRFNDDPNADLNTLDCATMTTNFPGTLGFAAKLNINGELLWCTMYNADDLLGNTWKASMLNDIEIVPQGGTFTYMAVGRSERTGAAGTKAFIALIDQDGVRIDKNRMAPMENPLLSGVGWPDENFGWFLSIARDPVSGKMAVSGFLQSGPAEAVVALIDPSVDPFTPE